MATARAYRVEYDGGYDTTMCVVHADTRNEARRLGAGELDTQYMEVTAKRAPEFDEIVGEYELIRAQLAMGWQWECYVCGERVDEDTRASVVRSGTVYCSSGCTLKELRRRRTERQEMWCSLERATERYPGAAIDRIYKNVADEWIACVDGVFRDV